MSTPAGSRFDALPPTLPPDPRRVDPYTAGLASLLGLVVIGFIVIGFGYRSVSRTVIEAGQLPGLVSGTITGILLVALGCGLAVVFTGRRNAAVLRAELARVEESALAVLSALPAEDAP